MELTIDHLSNDYSSELLETVKPMYHEPAHEANPLRVVMVSEASLEHTSGVTNSVKKVASHLLGEGHEVTIVCPGPAPKSFGEADVIATKSVNLMGFDVGRKSTKKFLKLLESLDPDVAHIAAPMRVPQGVLFLGGNAIDATHRLEIPTVAVYQTDAVRFAGHLGLGLTSTVVERQLRKFHNKADINLVPSTASHQDLVSWGVNPETIRHWARGVDTRLFHIDRRDSEEVRQLRAKWAPNGEVVLGVVSRLEPEKSLHKLEVLTDLPSTRLVIIGEGTSRKILAAHLGKEVIFTGKLTGEDLAIAYAALDIFTFPGVADTFGQVIQEAHASGVPVIAANRGGPRDLVSHGETGFLYEPSKKHRKDKQLKAYVEQLVNDKDLRQSMGLSAWQSVQGRTWYMLGEQVVDYYKESINLRGQKMSISQAIGRLASAQ